MLNVFFRKIPSIVFEPVALVGLLGLILAFLLFRRKNTVLFWTVFIFLIFMAFWRVAIQIVSSRYAAILIFPMTLAAVFFVFQSEQIRKVLPAFPEKYAKFLPAALLAILTLISVGNNLNFDSSSSVMETAQLLKADRISGESLIFSLNPDRCKQIEYYTGLKTVKLDPKLKRFYDSLTPELCRRILELTAPQKGDALYIFAISPTKAPVLTAAETGVEESSWKLFSEKYMNRKKKRVLRVYRYCP